MGDYIFPKSQEGYSPGQIAGRICREWSDLETNHESIYRNAEMLYLVVNVALCCLLPCFAYLFILNSMMSEQSEKLAIQPLSGHWADVYAAKILREKANQELYTCASGITPSGVVHIGNVREVISVELIYRALKQHQVNVRFIYSWDNYDVFRKVPKGLAKPEYLKSYLRQPLTRVPDTQDGTANYAEANQKPVEQLLPLIGIEPEYLYQAQRYEKGDYAENIVFVLRNRQKIRTILNEFRSEDLAADWWPLSIFCQKCSKDTTKIKSWDGEYSVSYYCNSCQKDAFLNLKNEAGAKLPWRIDWPMRWQYEKVDFEPAGKEHHSAGGSFSTAQRISQEIFNYPAPISFKYDFIRLKGLGGKMSSSQGEAVSLKEVLQVYQPQIVRYLFVSTRPDSEFAISFDLDVLKIYEDYDRCVRAYYERAPEGTKAYKKQEKLWRIFELSQLQDVPRDMPYLIPLRHLCNLLQIHDGNIEACLNFLDVQQSEQRTWLTQRCTCAWHWLKNFAPEEFRFQLRKQSGLHLEAQEQKAILALYELIDKALHKVEEKEFAQQLYRLMEKLNYQSENFFPLVYRCLIEREKGPRLVSFLHAIGANRIKKILSLVLGGVDGTH